MPKIPRFTSEKVIESPFIPQGVAGGPSLAAAELGTGIAELGQIAAEDVAKVREAEEKAIRTLKFSQIKRGLDEDANELSSSLKDRIDYENFETDTEKGIEGIRKKYSKQIGNDPILQLAFEQKFNDYAATLTNVARDKKHDVVTELTKGEYRATTNRTLENYSNESDKTKRDIIRTEYEIETWDLVASHVLTKDQAIKSLEDFDNISELVRADKLIEVDAKGAEIALRAGEFDLDPTKTQAKIKAAIIQQGKNEVQERIRRNEEERRQEKSEQAAHKKETQDIADLINSGNFTDAQKIIDDSERLTGAEKISYSSAVRTLSKKEPALDWEVYGKLLEKINLDPESIKSESEIWSTKKLGNKYQGLVDLWNKKIDDPDDPKNARATRYQRTLKELKTKYIFSDDDKENAELYGEKANEFDQYLRENKDVTDKEVEDYFHKLIEPDKQGWFSRMIQKAHEWLIPKTEAEKAEKKRVVQTGKTRNGQKVEKHSDGTISYAD